MRSRCLSFIGPVSRSSRAPAFSSASGIAEDALARLRGSIAQSHDEEVRKLAEDHEQVLAAKNREMANLTTQLKQVLQRYQQTHTALQRERDKFKEALLLQIWLHWLQPQLQGW